MSYSVATWNINSVRLRIDLVTQFLADHQPDILCLQEIKCQNDQFPEKAFRKAGYEHFSVHGQKSYHGVATVSKHPILDSSSLDFCDVGDSRHLSTTHAVGGQNVQVHNYYVPAGGDDPDPVKNPKFDHKLKFLNEMKGMTPTNDDLENIMVGDLNIAPHENDVWSHKQLLKVVSHTPIETQLLDEVRDTTGWVDLVRQKIDYEQRLFSWWSYRAKDWDKADKGRRLDHIWSSAKISEQLESIEVLRALRGYEKPSDHVPVVARFSV